MWPTLFHRPISRPWSFQSPPQRIPRTLIDSEASPPCFDPPFTERYGRGKTLQNFGKLLAGRNVSKVSEWLLLMPERSGANPEMGPPHASQSCHLILSSFRSTSLEFEQSSLSSIPAVRRQRGLIDCQNLLYKNISAAYRLIVRILLFFRPRHIPAKNTGIGCTEILAPSSTLGKLGHGQEAKASGRAGKTDGRAEGSCDQMKFEQSGLV